MPVVDYGNKLKVAGIQKINAAKKKFSREVLTNTGRNAGKLTAINKITLPEIIEQSLSSINEAIESGNFHAFIEAGDKYKSKVADYFRKAGYIVFYNGVNSGSTTQRRGRWSYRGSDGDVFVTWIGCKNWVKSRELNGSKREDIINKMYSEIKTLIHDTWGEDKNGLKLFSPNMPKNFMDDPKSAKKSLSRFNI